MIKRIKFENKPLVETIFEIRWELEKTKFGFMDPNYKLIIGRMYDKLKDEYSFYEQLPMANIPDGIAEYITQHRFRVGKNKWPLIQIGQGILTVNDTENYIWEDFEKRISQAVKTLIEVYPNGEEKIKVNKKVLRYIDSVEFNYEKDNIFDFLKDKMKTNVGLYKKLFEKTGVIKIPLGFDLRFSFESTKPKGVINLRFRKGKNKNVDSLIWELLIESTQLEVSSIEENISKWVSEGHALTDEWFFKLIEGDLFRRFK